VIDNLVERSLALLSSFWYGLSMPGREGTGKESRRTHNRRERHEVKHDLRP
jgi:hypothetical protein